MRQIFWTASDSRVENRELRKDKMQATIPVFLALMHADPAKKFHMHFGQVEFAYKDQERPQFKEAEDALTQAIQIRGSWQKHNFVLYELNRAICRIQLENEKVEQGIPPTAASKAAILEDLRVLSANEEMAKRVLEGTDRENTAIREWMKRNNIDPKKEFGLASS